MSNFNSGKHWPWPSQVDNKINYYSVKQQLPSAKTIAFQDQDVREGRAALTLNMTEPSHPAPGAGSPLCWQMWHLKMSAVLSLTNYPYPGRAVLASLKHCTHTGMGVTYRQRHRRRRISSKMSLWFIDYISWEKCKDLFPRDRPFVNTQLGGVCGGWQAHRGFSHMSKNAVPSHKGWLGLFESLKGAKTGEICLVPYIAKINKKKLV